jgi:hypothetical protein
MVVTNINNPGESDTVVSAFSAPAGCVPVRQLQRGESGNSTDIVPAPPRTARESVDTGKCVRPGCAGLRQRGHVECAPHRMQTEKMKAAHGNAAKH